jgi:hypothetical protein
LDVADPHILFIDGVRRFKGDTRFDYEKWIKVFTDKQVANQSPPLQVTVKPWEKMSVWWGKFNQCVKEGSLSVRDSECLGVESSCAHNTQYTIVSPLTTVTVSHDGSWDPSHPTELLSRTSDERFLYKLFHPEKSETCQAACFERTTLDILDGLGDIFPGSTNLRLNRRCACGYPS